METKRDILERQQFVEQMDKVVWQLAERKKGCAIAIDGKWGSGKTFVLNMFSEKLHEYQSEESGGNKYFLFHYNCWQYDYYEEPAIAIVSAMIEAIEKENSFFGEVLDGYLKVSFDVAKEKVKRSMKTIAGKFVENRIGINVVEIWDEIHGEYKKLQQEEDEGKKEFDTLFAFKKTMDETRELLKEIAEEKTIVFIVDELDRCIPAYAIKVLERLHHLFDGIDNIILIIAIDKRQLDYSIKEIYGIDVKSEEYLKKMIDLTLYLDTGKMRSCYEAQVSIDVENKIWNKYESYWRGFKGTKEEFSAILNFFVLLWENIDIRTQEKTMEKMQIVHELVGQGEIHGLAIALFEMIIMRFQNEYKENILERLLIQESEKLNGVILELAKNTLKTKAVLLSQTSENFEVSGIIPYLNRAICLMIYLAKEKEIVSDSDRIFSCNLYHEYRSMAEFQNAKIGTIMNTPEFLEETKIAYEFMELVEIIRI